MSYPNNYQDTKVAIWCELTGCCQGLVEIERAEGGTVKGGVTGYLQPYLDDLDRVREEYKAGRREWPWDLDEWRKESAGEGVRDE